MVHGLMGTYFEYVTLHWKFIIYPFIFRAQKAREVLINGLSTDERLQKKEVVCVLRWNNEGWLKFCMLSGLVLLVSFHNFKQLLKWMSG